MTAGCADKGDPVIALPKGPGHRLRIDGVDLAAGSRADQNPSCRGVVAEIADVAERQAIDPEPALAEIARKVNALAPGKPQRTVGQKNGLVQVL